MQMGLSLGESLQKFTLLSIGDGLVSQIPALILSVGAGILVTRASDNMNVGAQVAGQFFRYPRAMKITGGMMIVFGLMPGMPTLPFLGLGVTEPTPAWGLMLTDKSADFYKEAPWMIIFPGLAITMAVFAFNMFGDSLRDWHAPKTKG